VSTPVSSVPPQRYVPAVRFTAHVVRPVNLLPLLCATLGPMSRKACVFDLSTTVIV
jgi:hypothetical protein